MPTASLSSLVDRGLVAVLLGALAGLLLGLSAPAPAAAVPSTAMASPDSHQTGRSSSVPETCAP